MRKIKYIYIHHSDSEWGTANDIRKWHKDKGWKDIGYSFVIGNGIPTYDDLKNGRVLECAVGNIEYGRPLDLDKELEDNEIGAHVYGKNSESIGICEIHKKKSYKPKMILNLFLLVIELMDKFDIPIKNVLGHYESDTKKPDCPGIDMAKFRNDLKWLTNNSIGPFSLEEMIEKYCI